MRYQLVIGDLAEKRPRSFSNLIFVVAHALIMVLCRHGTAQAAEPKPLKVTREIRALSGSLDKMAVFNSNSPELVTREGILLSTFPGDRGASHLDYAFDGRFDVFSHHVASSAGSGRKEDLYLGLIVGNTSTRPVQVSVKNAASYLTLPDAPFIALSPLIANDDGRVFAGPGDRVTLDLLRERQGSKWKKTVEVLPGERIILHKFAIPTSKVKPHLNGRTYISQLQSSGPVRLALVAGFARPKRRIARFFAIFAPLPLITRGKYRAPDKEDLLEIFDQGRLIEPRDRPPTSPEDKGPIRYGRVSGVSIGSTWTATLADLDSQYLSLPPPGKTISYVVASLKGATFGTGQDQSAPLAVRYKDTAYQANGNYGVKYDLTIPVKNVSDRNLMLNLSLETPVKSDTKSDTVTFYEPPLRQIFFRGTIKISLLSESDVKVRYVHIVQRRGEMGEPFFNLPVAAGKEQTVRVEFFYPPDCTPPHLLTLSTAPM
ncbi:MAG TPA: DUF3370 domain-containing protein [Candidatus Obscuribacterales bacterium]